jgi:hypothetical protein
MIEEVLGVRIPESRVRVVLALLTPPLMLGMALLTLAVDSHISVPIVFGLLGTFLAVVVLFDFPLALNVGDDGLTRVCLLRHHVVPWDQVGAIIKPRRRGLVLVTVDRKRHVLVDKILDSQERKVLLDVGEEHDFQVEI